MYAVNKGMSNETNHKGDNMNQVAYWDCEEQKVKMYDETLVALLKRARYYLKSDHSIPCTDLINEIDEKLTTIERGA